MQRVYILRISTQSKAHCLGSAQEYTIPYKGYLIPAQDEKSSSLSKDKDLFAWLSSLRANDIATGSQNGKRANISPSSSSW